MFSLTVFEAEKEAENAPPPPENCQQNSNQPFADRKELPMIYGYARCSTCEKKQDVQRQIRELKAAGA